MRSLRFIIILFIFLIGLLLVSLPSMINTPWGQRQVVSWINRSIPGQVEIRNIHVQWGHGQTIEGFVLKDPQGNSILEFENFFTEASLWQLMKKSTYLGHTKLQDLHAIVKTDERGISNLQYALGIKTEQPQTIIPPTTIFLSNTHADFNLSTQSPLSLHLRGDTKQEQLIGSFDIQAELPPILSDNWEEMGKNAHQLLSIEGSKEAKLEAKIENFPVDLLDQILAIEHPELNGVFRKMMGEKINVNVNKEPSAEGLAFNLTLLAPLLQSSIKGKIEHHQLTLNEPALFTFHLLPSSFNSLIGNNVQLLESSQLTVTMNELSFPLSFFETEGEINPCAIGIAAQAQLQSHTHIHIPSLGTMNILHLNTNLHSPRCIKDIHIHVTGQGQQENQEPFEADLQANINQVSPNLFDLIFSVKTNRIHVNQAHFQIGKEINLISPINFEYVLEPNRLNPYLEPHEIALKYPTPIHVTIDQLKIPNGDKISLSAHIRTSLVHMTHLPTLYSLQFKNALVKADGALKSDLTLQLTSELDLLNPDGSQAPFLGNKSLLTVASHSTLQPNDQISFSHMITHFTSDIAQLSMEGNLFPNSELVLTKPLTAEYKLTPDVIRSLHLTDEEYEIKNIPTLSFEADPFRYHFKEAQLDTLTVKGLFAIDSVVLENGSRTTATLKPFDVSWEINSPLNIFRMNIKGEAYAHSDQKPSELAAQILISNWLKEGKYDLSKLKIEVSSNLTGVPTSLVSSLVVKEDLTPLLGSIFDLELNTLIDRYENTPGHWDMILDSPLIHLKARLKIGEAITLYETSSRSIEFRWTLTPEGYQYLNELLEKPSPKMPMLASDLVLKGFFTDLFIPLRNVDPTLAGGNFNTSFETNDIVWKDSVIPTFKLKGQVQSSNLSKQIEFTLHTLSKDPASLAINGEVSNLFNEKRDVQFARSDMNVDIQAKHLPAKMVQTILFLDPPQGKQLEAAIGPEMDAQISAQLLQMEGPITGDIQGSKGHISLDGQVKKGVLLLKKPFEWETRFSPELSKAFFKNDSILSSAIGAENPLKLTISPEGFALPLIPFDLNQVMISKGSLDLGKMHFRNEGDLKTILTLLKPIPEDQVIIWFTPFYFQVSKGTLVLKRMDMFVADHYHLANWGQIDLNTYKLNLTLGISEQALNQAFNIQGLDPNYMLQVPMKGKNGKIEIDTAKAIARISALVAQTHGNDTVKILGSVLDIATNVQEPVPPPPTTTSLPWERGEKRRRSAPQQQMNVVEQEKGEKENRKEENGEKESHKRRKKEKDEGIMKEIEKGASTLFELLNKS